MASGLKVCPSAEVRRVGAFFWMWRWEWRRWVFTDRGEQGTWPYKPEGFGTRTKGAVGMELTRIRNKAFDKVLRELPT